MRKSMPKALTAAAAVASAALLASALPGYANHHGGGHKAERSINIAEIQTRTAERFAAIDTDGDGLVNETEFSSAPRDESRGDKPRHHKKPHGKRSKREFSDEEKAERNDQAFAALDTDADGVISSEEFEKRHEVMKQIRSEGRRASRFQKMDANGDGSITLEEMQTKLERLRTADTDGDGVVTRTEMRALRSKAASAPREG